MNKPDAQMIIVVVDIYCHIVAYINKK